VDFVLSPHPSTSLSLLKRSFPRKETMIKRTNRRRLPLIRLDQDKFSERIILAVERRIMGRRRKEEIIWVALTLLTLKETMVPREIERRRIKGKRRKII